MAEDAMTLFTKQTRSSATLCISWNIGLLLYE